LLNDPIVEFIRAHGGLRAIAFSHPHYYSNMNDGRLPLIAPFIFIAMTSNSSLTRQLCRMLGREEKPLWDGMRLINVGGHFPGSSILHVPHLSPEGTVFSGDTLVIAPNKQI